jgi:hypothetical protein
MDKRTGKKLKYSALSHLCFKIQTKGQKGPLRKKEIFLKRVRRKANIHILVS